MSLFAFKFLCIFFIIFMIFSVVPNMLFQGHADSESVTHKTGISDFNFVVAGDFSCNKEANKTVNNMATKKPEIVLTVDDHSYRKSADCWFDTVSPLDIDGKLKIAFGEHDIDDNLTKYKTYLRHFNLTDPYYSFDYQNVHFLAMATGKNMVIPYMINSAQYDFVKNDLKSAHENKNVNWIVVLSYRPLYSSISTHSGKTARMKKVQFFAGYSIHIFFGSSNEGSRQIHDPMTLR